MSPGSSDAGCALLVSLSRRICVRTWFLGPYLPTRGDRPLSGNIHLSWPYVCRNTADPQRLARQGLQQDDVAKTGEQFQACALLPTSAGSPIAAVADAFFADRRQAACRRVCVPPYCPLHGHPVAKCVCLKSRIRYAVHTSPRSARSPPACSRAPAAVPRDVRGCPAHAAQPLGGATALGRS